MQQGKMVSAYSDAVKGAAENSNGAMNGFMGIGMMNMATGNVMGNAVAGPWQDTSKSTIDMRKQEEVKPEENSETTSQNVESDIWKCSCGTENTGKFCTNCGNPKPKNDECKNCGNKLAEGTKFCPNCGEKVD